MLPNCNAKTKEILRSGKRCSEKNCQGEKRSRELPTKYGSTDAAKNHALHFCSQETYVMNNDNPLSFSCFIIYRIMNVT